MNEEFEKAFIRAFFTATAILSGIYLATLAYQFGYRDAFNSHSSLTQYVRNRIIRDGNVLTVPFRKSSLNEDKNESPE